MKNTKNMIITICHRHWQERQFRRGILLFTAGIAFGMNGEHSTGMMVLFAIMATKGLSMLGHSVLQPVPVRNHSVY